jgi:hypothetical protein
MATPYITPSVLMNQPAGLSWQVVPTLTADVAQQTAQLALVCQQVTSLIDGYLHQPLRAIAVTEEDRGPFMPRVSVDPGTGIAGLITRQWPVIAVNAIQVSQARCFPPQWTPVPADQSRIRTPVLMPAPGLPVTNPSGGNAIDVAPGHISARRGRGAWLVSKSYTSGYPHAGLAGVAQPVQSGTQQVQVDDVTGWQGWTGWILDGPATEPVTVTAAQAAVPVQLPGPGGTVQAGAGTLTLSAPLQNEHPGGTIITAIPLAGLHAAALSAAVIALENIAAIAVQSSSGQLPGGLGALATESEMALDPFVRRM